VLATSGTYMWSFVTQIFHRGQPRLNKWKNKYRCSRIYSRGFIVHIYYGSVFLANVNYQTAIAETYCFVRKKVGCDRVTSPLFEPGVHLRFEIWTPTSFLVNKTSLAQMFSRDITYIFLIYHQVVYILYSSLCFVAWHHIYFIFAHDWAWIFPFKAWHNNSLKQKILQNLQHKLLLRIQQTTLYEYLRGGSRTFHNGGRFSSDNCVRP
jgi:hypothetical protein